MWDNLIAQNIRTANRNLLVTNLIVLALAAVVAIGARRYLYNVFEGPFPASHDELLRITNANNQSRYYVSVTDVTAKDIDLQVVERTRNRYTDEVTSEKIAATYYAADLGSKLLLIRSPERAPGSSYTGAIAAIPSGVRSWLQAKRLDALNRKFDDTFLPFMIDATPFKTGAYVSLAFGIPLAALAAYNVLKAVKRRGQLRRAPDREAPGQAL
jgi:hypothetical protein